MAFNASSGLTTVVAILPSVVFLGCLQPRPMSPAEVDQISHCAVPLKQVKKNLLAAGYGLQVADEESLVTDYKEVRNRYDGKTLRRISAFTEADGRVRVTFREKDIVTDQLRDSKGADVGTRTFEAEREPNYDHRYSMKLESVRVDACGEAPSAPTGSR